VIGSETTASSPESLPNLPSLTPSRAPPRLPTSASPAEVAQLRPPTGGAPRRAHAGSDSRNKINQLGQLGVSTCPGRGEPWFNHLCEHEQPRAHQHPPSINVLNLTGIAPVPPMRTLRQFVTQVGQQVYRQVIGIAKRWALEAGGAALVWLWKLAGRRQSPAFSRTINRTSQMFVRRLSVLHRAGRMARNMGAVLACRGRTDGLCS
jgi:hypothetical protein